MAYDKKYLEDADKRREQRNSASTTGGASKLVASGKDALPSSYGQRAPVGLHSSQVKAPASKISPQKESIHSDFIDEIKGCTRETLEKLSKLLEDLTPEEVRKGLDPLIRRFLKGNGVTKTPESAEIKGYIDTLIEAIKKVKINVVFKINDGAAKAETRVPPLIKFPGFLNQSGSGMSLASIDLAQRGKVTEKSPDGIQYLPNTETSKDTPLYKELLQKRTFTLLHELTHSALATLDKTDSISGNATTAHKLEAVGSLKKPIPSVANYAVNADSWTVFIFKALDVLQKIKTEKQKNMQAESSSGISTDGD